MKYPLVLTNDAEASMIKFNHVFKIYEKNIQALEDINFEVQKGEFAFITGPSGAGKTTVLKLLYREEIPDMGTVLFDSQDTAHIHKRKLPYYRRNIGFVFQDFKLLFDRTVFENIALPLVITGASREYIKKTVDDSIIRIGLAGKEKFTPWHLSGGEKQKVATARALITAPPVVLADEPTGNLDDDSAREIIKIFSEINEKGTTVLFATHSKEIMQEMGKRVIKLREGRIVE